MYVLFVQDFRQIFYFWGKVNWLLHLYLKMNNHSWIDKYMHILIIGYMSINVMYKIITSKKFQPFFSRNKYSFFISASTRNRNKNFVFQHFFIVCFLTYNRQWKQNLISQDRLVVGADDISDHLVIKNNLDA